MSPVAEHEAARVAARESEKPAGSAAVSLVRDLISLTKPRITSLVLVTGGAGLSLAPGHVSLSRALIGLIGTTLIVSSANALNMWWERDVDGQMARTRTRPLPAGRMAPDVALVFGLALAVLGLPLLFSTNLLTGILGLGALIAYVAIYTPLKKRTWLALLVGAVPGAMPPLMGWTTVTGRIDIGGFLLFFVLFLWQIPHFAAITLFRTADYARAGLSVVAVERGERGAKQVIFIYTALLVAASVLLHTFHVGGAVYLAVALVTGAAFVAMGVSGSGPRWARRLFAYSIVYLVAILCTLLIDRAT